MLDNRQNHIVNDAQNLEGVTTVEHLAVYARGQVVRFSDFSEGQPLIARVKRPSLIALAKSGKIPNQLMTTANEMFTRGLGDTKNNEKMSDFYEITEIICECTLIEPSLAQIKEAGLELTDEQIIEIFNYSQQGVKALIPFSE